MDTQELPKNLTLEKVIDLKKRFWRIYDENLKVVPVYSKELDEFHKIIYSEDVGISKDLKPKEIGLIIEQWYETLTKTPEYETTTTEAPQYSTPTDTNTVTPDVGVREIQEQERQYREAETLKSQEKAKTDELSFEKRLEKAFAKRLWSQKTKDLQEIEVAPKTKEFIFEMAQAAKLDAGTTQEHVEGLIKASIPKDQIDEYPESLIKNRAHNFVTTLGNFADYKSVDEIPNSFVVEPPIAPLTSLINPDHQEMVNIFTDRFVRENIASDAQQTILALSAQRDLDAEIFEPAVFGGNKQLTAIFFGEDEITKFDPSENDQDGIEITIEDLKTLHNNNVEVQKFFKKYLEIDGAGAEVVSTGFTPLRIPESELKSVDTSKVIGKKHILGGIEGEETQGALARRILREKTKLFDKLDKVVSINPSTNPLVVQKTKSILAKISGQVVPQTIVKSTAINPIRLGISIGGGSTPVSLELSGNFGGSTKSFLKLMRDTNTPLILTSLVIGSYATSDLAITSAIASQFNGKVLAYIGAGKYSFSVVNAGNTIIGGQSLTYHTVRLQLGKKFFELGFSGTAGKVAYSTKLGFTQAAGKITSATLTKGVGTGVVTKTALPAFFAKIANLLGLAGGWATFGLSIIAGWIIGKIIEALPKIKNWISRNKEVLIVGGLTGMFLFGGGARVLFAIPTLIGAGALFAGGFFFKNVFRTIGSAMSAIFFVTYGDILKPLLIFILTTPFVVALILFIINSGAYVVPPSPLDSAFTTSGGGFPIVCSEEKGPVGVDGPFSASPIGNRAWEITYDLYQGFWCFWNRSPISPPQYFPNDTLKYPPGYPNLFDYNLFRSNPNPAPNLSGSALYWCTWLIVHAYNETGTSTPTNLWVPNMYNDFVGRGKILDARNATASTLPAGSVVFFHVTTGRAGLNHVGIVYSTDKAGITIVQSNAPTKSFRVPWANITGVGTMQIVYFGKP